MSRRPSALSIIREAAEAGMLVRIIYGTDGSMTVEPAALTDGPPAPSVRDHAQIDPATVTAFQRRIRDAQRRA